MSNGQVDLRSTSSLYLISIEALEFGLSSLDEGIGFDPAGAKVDL